MLNTEASEADPLENAALPGPTTSNCTVTDSVIDDLFIEYAKLEKQKFDNPIEYTPGGDVKGNKDDDRGNNGNGGTDDNQLKDGRENKDSICQDSEEQKGSAKTTSRDTLSLAQTLNAAKPYNSLIVLAILLVYNTLLQVFLQQYLNREGR